MGREGNLGFVWLRGQGKRGKEGECLLTLPNLFPPSWKTQVLFGKLPSPVTHQWDSPDAKAQSLRYSPLSMASKRLRFQTWSPVGGRLGVTVWAFVLFSFSFSLCSLFVRTPSPIP